MDHKIPYKIYLEEHEMPKEWYNVRADMKKKPAPILMYRYRPVKQIYQYGCVPAPRRKRYIGD